MRYRLKRQNADLRIDVEEAELQFDALELTQQSWTDRRRGGISIVSASIMAMTLDRSVA
jgi:hypothetical protein